jgi:hypothetical protein
MSISMYDVSIPLFILSLNKLTAILDKAESHAAAFPRKLRKLIFALESSQDVGAGPRLRHPSNI